MKIIGANKLITIFLGSMVLIACSGEEIQSVEWYSENPEARITMLQRCLDNLEKLKDTPNCQNAEKAEIQASTGSLRTFDF